MVTQISRTRVFRCRCTVKYGYADFMNTCLPLQVNIQRCTVKYSYAHFMNTCLPLQVNIERCTVKYSYAHFMNTCLPLQVNIERCTVKYGYADCINTCLRLRVKFIEEVLLTDALYALGLSSELLQWECGSGEGISIQH